MAEPDPAATVTLVTGDRVTLHTVGGRDVPSVEPGDGREDVLFAVRTTGDRIEVLPSDAVALVAAGRLDPRLFDVAALQRMGYGDADRPDVPLIVQDEGSGRRVPEAKVEEAGATTEALPAAKATGVRQPKATTGELWDELTRGEAQRTLEGGIGKVWLDGLAQPTLDVSVPHIGAPSAWAAGWTGAGTTVAVIDSGIDDTHPDLAGKVAERRNFVDDIDDDMVGHGTHVASTIAGSGAASEGRNRGVAPDARLLDAKVCFEEGCPESAIIAGMLWAAESGATVANVSLGGPDAPGVDPLEAAVDNLSAQYGTLFVVAAGNDGPAAATVGSPATADAALAVTAVDDADRTADFSSRGPRSGDHALKPDISGPGVDITAARARHAIFGEPGEPYAALDGTSMATPHVAGAAALLHQQHPDWTGPQLKAHLMAAAAPDEAVDVLAQGAGRVDVARAVTQQAHAEPASLSFGLQAWPHDDDEVLTRTLTYRNPGEAPLTLALDLTTTGPDGAPAPAGMFTLGADTVTVPAGGNATVEVTVDTRVDGPDGGYGARITAADSAGDGTTVVTTPVSVAKEVESYDLTVANLDPDAEPAELYVNYLAGLDTDFDRTFHGSDGTVTVRVPKGRYNLESTAFRGLEGERLSVAWLVQPLVDVSADTTVELDARRARPFSIEFPDEVVAAGESASYLRQAGERWVGSGWISFTDLDGVTSAHFGPEVPRDEMTTELFGNWFAGPAKLYHLAWYGHGRMLTGADEQVVDARLATVKAGYRAAGAGTGQEGFSYAVAEPLEGVGSLSAFGNPLPLPQRRTELYSADSVRWSPEADPDGNSFLAGEPRVYRAGRSYREEWNGAVRGPAPSVGRDGFPAFLCPNTGRREGDVITIAVPLLTDAAGHSGCSPSVPATTRLLRDGEVVGETDQPATGEFTVPADPGTYRLETDVDHSATTAISTRITAAWTFRSQHVEGEEPAPVPLMAVRFAPELDRHNRAPAGRTLAVPVTVDKAGGVGRVGKPAVEASFDDGATWVKIPVQRRADGTYVAQVTHPRRAEHVSLRAKVTDDQGNAVEQTITRAYLLK